MHVSCKLQPFCITRSRLNLTVKIVGQNYIHALLLVTKNNKKSHIFEVETVILKYFQ